MSKYSEALALMQEEWAMSQGQYDQQFGGEQIEEGVYECRLQSAALRLSKANSNLMIGREHLITKGTMQGRVIYDQLMMTSARNMVYVRHWIEMMGYQAPTDPEEVEATVEAIVAERADVKVRVTKDGDYTNAEVVELLGVNSSPESDGEVTAEVTAEATAEATAEVEYTLQDLLEFCGEVGIDLTNVDLEDVEAVMNEIKAYAIPESSLKEGRADMLRAVGLGEAIAEDETTATAETEVVDPVIEKLVQFCIGQNIEYDPTDTKEIFIERIDAFTYPVAKLTPDEIALLKEVGLEKDIIEPPPVKKAPIAKKAPPIAKKAPAATATKKLPLGKKLPPKRK